MAHAAPTRQVIAGFRPITADNRRIVLQEWLAEAFTTWGIAAVVIVVTAVSGPGTGARTWVYRTAALLLIALAALTALTGARTPVVWFKICPVPRAGSAVLLLIASVQWQGHGTTPRPPGTQLWRVRGSCRQGAAPRRGANRSMR